MRKYDFYPHFGLLTHYLLFFMYVCAHKKTPEL